MKQLGLALHWHRQEVIELAQKAITWCENSGLVQLSMGEREAQLVGRPDLLCVENFGQGLDACLSIGGDGTILHAAALVSKYDVPILGINAGNLGYLAEIDPENLETVLDAWVKDDLAEEERMMLKVTIPNGSEDPQTNEFHCLNEVVLYRSQSGRTMSIGAKINGKDFLSYTADGVVLATPTGSTAYSLSAGGPIVEPGFKALVLTPVAAHMAFNRSMVFPPETSIEFVVEGYRPAEVTIDGRTVAHLDPGDLIICTASQRTAKFLKHEPRDFHATLKDKFGIKDIR